MQSKWLIALLEDGLWDHYIGDKKSARATLARVAWYVTQSHTDTRGTSRGATTTDDEKVRA